MAQRETLQATYNPAHESIRIQIAMGVAGTCLQPNKTMLTFYASAAVVIKYPGMPFWEVVRKRLWSVSW